MSIFHSHEQRLCSVMKLGSRCVVDVMVRLRAETRLSESEGNYNQRALVQEVSPGCRLPNTKALCSQVESGTVSTMR